MTNGTEVEIGVRPVEVPEAEIIRAGPQVAKKEVSITLTKSEIPIVIPPQVTPLPTPTITPSPLPFAPIIPVTPGKNPLIINIETEGLYPWKHRIISIGLQDPSFPNELPTVIMMEDEALMIKALFNIIREFGHNQVIGYGYSFDLRFVVVRAMKFGITCKEFSDMDIYDLGQAMAQVKFQFVYYPQRQPKLSDIANFFWGYPKPFTDLEMMKYYKRGMFDKVVEFTSSQITRILLLYSLFRSITENPITSFSPGVEGSKELLSPPNTISAFSEPTTSGVSNPELETRQCKECLADNFIQEGDVQPTCTICGAKL